MRAARREPFRSRTLEPYKAYNFRDKDPVIDELRTLIEDEIGHRMTRKDLRAIEALGGPRVGTMANWFFGKTRRPISAGTESCGRALGYHRTWTRMSASAAAISRRGALTKRTPRLRVIDGGV